MGRAPANATRALLGQRPTVLLPPSTFVEPSEQDVSPPSTHLQLEWAYGYNGHTVGAVHWISEKEFVFTVAAVGVVQCLHPAKQRIFVGHSQRITCLSYCPTLKLCASGQMDPKGSAGPFICLWRPADCILLTVLVFPVHEDHITSLCFNLDGSQLFSMARDSANTLALWESFLPMKTGHATSAGMELPHVYRKPVAKVATGKVPACGMAGSKDASNFQVAIFDAGKSTIGVLLKFVCVVDGDLRARSAIFPPNSAPRHVLNVAWINGECLACGDNGFLYIFQGTSAACCHRISTGPLTFVAPLTAEQLLLGTKDSVLHFCHWSGQAMDVVASVPFSQLKGAALMGSAGPVCLNTAAVAAAGVLIGSENHHLVLLDPIERRVKQLLQLSHRGEVDAMAVHPDPQMKLLATAGAQDATLRFWDVDEHQPVVGRVLKFDRRAMGIFSLAFNPSGRLLAIGFGDGSLQLLTFPALCAERGRYVAGAERLAVLCFVGDNMLAVGSWDQTVYLFDISSDSRSPVRLLKGNTSSVTHMQPSIDGRYLMTNSKDGQVLFFNVLSGERVTQDTVKDETWDWSCPCAWHTMGMWAANKHLGIAGIKSCRAFKAATGESLLASGDVAHRVKLYHFPSMSGKQGFHCYDGHAGFVSGMLTVPSEQSLVTHLLTVGADDGALLQWRLVSTPREQQCAWQDQERLKPPPMRLQATGGKASQPAERRRPPWEHVEPPLESSKGRSPAPGPWVQHGSTDLPYAEHMEVHVPKKHIRQREATQNGDTLHGAAGAATASLSTAASRDARSRRPSAGGPVPEPGAAGKATAVKDERKSFRQHGGIFAERHWLDSGAIIASVASKLKTAGEEGPPN